MRISELYKNQSSPLALEDLEVLFTSEGYTVSYITFAPTGEMYIDGHTKLTKPYTVLCVNRKIVCPDNRILGITEFIGRLAYLNRSCGTVKVNFELVHQGNIDSHELFKSCCGSTLPTDIPTSIKMSYKRLQDFITWAATLNNPDVTDLEYLTKLDSLKMLLDDDDDDEEELDE